jgi:hypothetical protein
VPRRERFLVPTIEGPLVFPRGALPAPPEWRGVFRVPGERLGDVEDARQREWLTVALGAEGLQPGDLCIAGVSGFALKGEDRPLALRPRHLEIEDDPRDAQRVRLRFELPRGAYATLVLARLAPECAVEGTDPALRRERPPAAERGPARGPRRAPDEGAERGPERGPERGSERRPPRGPRRPRRPDGERRRRP